jgi:putative transposase
MARFSRDRCYSTVRRRTTVVREKLAHYIDFYNRRRPHTALDRHTPDDRYFGSLPQQQAA